MIWGTSMFCPIKGQFSHFGASFSWFDFWTCIKLSLLQQRHFLPWMQESAEDSSYCHYFDFEGRSWQQRGPSSNSTPPERPFLTTRMRTLQILSSVLEIYPSMFEGCELFRAASAGTTKESASEIWFPRRKLHSFWSLAVIPLPRVTSWDSAKTTWLSRRRKASEDESVEKESGRRRIMQAVIFRCATAFKLPPLLLSASLSSWCFGLSFLRCNEVK